MQPIRLIVLVLAGVGGIPQTPAFAQRVNYEEAPISYSLAAPDNAISGLQERIDSGEHALRYEGEQGYLKSLLEALKIFPSSQVMPFGRTSLQDDKISPTTPRAIYFNDEVHVGFVRNGLLEIAVHDARLGMVFYTLKQTEEERPVFRRQTNSCLTCHGAARTRNVPGLLVRSVYPDPGGHPVVAAGSFLTNHRSPLNQRWGGWYVTGTHGDQSHIGNFTLTTAKKPKTIDNSAGHNVTDLSGRFDVTAYLTPHSDIVALMVLEHQTDTLNVLTQASFEVRHAIYVREQAMANDSAAVEAAEKALAQRVDKAADLVVRSLLFAEETRLTAPIVGTSSFARDFAAGARKDRQGRSLRDFDLQTRMFRYPCSYLIETAAFDSLPDTLKAAVGQRLRDILTASTAQKGFEHLSDEDRAAVAAILADLKPELMKTT